MRLYFTRHAWGNATLADLLAALEQASGRDLSGWSAQWLETTGLNTLRPEFTVDRDGAFASFAVLQDGARPGAGELRTHRLAVGVYDSPADREGGALVRTHRVELDVSEGRTEVPELIGVPAGQLVLVNDDDLTYCTMRLDEKSLATLVDRIGDITESLPRSLCWSAAWEMTREAEFKARDFVAVVLAGLPAETEVGVVQRLLAQAQLALSSYADPVWASEDGWPSFAGTLMNLVSAADPGFDHQLALVNALTTSLLGKPELDALAGWLAGDGVPEALAVDTDLRWRLLQALAAHGVMGEDEIAAEQDRDATATGRRQAKRTRALLPTPADKERAWQQAMCDDELPNAISEATIGGFATRRRSHCCRRTWTGTSPRSPRCGTAGLPSEPSRAWSGCFPPGSSSSAASTLRAGGLKPLTPARTPSTGCRGAGRRGPGAGRPCLRRGRLVSGIKCYNTVSHSRVRVGGEGPQAGGQPSS